MNFSKYILSVLSILISIAHAGTPQHGFAVFGNLKYPADFKNYDYVNPEAPKGGRLNLGVLGTFDSLNPFIVKGTPASGINLIHARLCDEAADRSGEAYAYLAERIEYPEDKSWVIFHINPKAKFSDGVDVTADDVIWSFESLREKGLPMFRTYYKNVSKIERLSSHSVKFYFNSTKNRELILVVGQLPILPSHYYKDKEFGETSLKPFPCSGPYKIKTLEPGRSITYERVKDWWGETLPTQRGDNNFDEINYDYYLDDNAMLEAFKAGKIDWRQEAVIRLWKTAYDFPARTAGFVKLEELKTALTGPTYGFFFNTRRDLFQDSRVRKALSLIFDFNWANKNLFYGAYKRNLSYYPNSPFAAEGAPKADELALLEPYRNQLPSEVFTDAFTLPDADDSQQLRQIQQQALDLLEEAGWKIKDQKLIHQESNRHFSFEIINNNKSFEKILLNFAQSLKRLGITLKIRMLDTATYVNRVEGLDYDMIIIAIPQSQSLGNEQRDFFGSERADVHGTYNYAGIKSKIVDTLIEELINSQTFGELGLRARALDRVLLFNYYIIPAWYSDVSRIAYWDKFDRPTILPKYNPADFKNWWYNPSKASAIHEKKSTKESGSIVTKFKNYIINLFSAKS